VTGSVASSRSTDTATPAVLLGGAENAVSAARALRRDGVPVVIVAEDASPAHRVRGVRSVRLGPTFDEPSLTAWLSDGTSTFHGAVLLPLSDLALTVVARDHAELVGRFKVIRMDPAVVATMLDKEATVEAARSAGLAVPRQWPVKSAVDLERIRHELMFPLLVKPRRTFELVRREGRKFFRVERADELDDAMRRVEGLPGGVVLLEFVPGSDADLASYNAVRHEGQVILEFTKRIERRQPANEGGATLHEMRDLADVAAAGRRFFEHIGLEGIGNVEFKRDRRDGQLKLIECNHRLTAATELAERSGVGVVRAVYEQAAGHARRRAVVPDRRWYWYPVRDLRSASKESLPAVLRWTTIALRRPVLPYWRWKEPGPSLQHAFNGIRSAITARRSRGRVGVPEHP
jgi:predicted ATP-grasp superfamily ATP-dependent carboligase